MLWTANQSHAITRMDTNEQTVPVDYAPLYTDYTVSTNNLKTGTKKKKVCIDAHAIKHFMSNTMDSSGAFQQVTEIADGFTRMNKCRMGLDALDRSGWKRSYFQKKFHEAFLASCARAFFKIDGPGAFQRSFQRIMEVNGWNDLNQEILISTPRRFGKTISVSMFAAALLFSCSAVELSIYSTCKRISQKLLRNVVKFLDLIYEDLKCPKMKILRANCEEIHILGPEGIGDIRVANSYPSKVS
jgi:hypothetical protein